MDEISQERASARENEHALAQRRARIVVAIGLVAITIGIAVVLTRPSPQAIGQNSVPLRNELATTGGGPTLCQGSEFVPGGTAQIALGLVPTGRGGSIELTVTAGGRAIARGSKAAGWSGSPVAVPISPTVPVDTTARICAELGPSETVQIVGTTGLIPTATAGNDLGGRMRITYLSDERRSWLARLPDVVEDIGNGRSWTGPGAALLIALLTFSSVAVAAALLTRPRG